jgi:hypothetical protein
VTMDVEKFEESLAAVRQLVALREKFKRQCEISEKIGSAMHDKVSMELSIMEIAICFGALDKVLEGL